MIKNIKKVQKFLIGVSSDGNRNVVATSQWPVPYQKREFKAYPVRERKKLDVTSEPYKIDDKLYINTRTFLYSQNKGNIIEQV